MQVLGYILQFIGLIVVVWIIITAGEEFLKVRRKLKEEENG
ncbi:unnamed protein product [marine sediment metagenome]|uniref:Uncharacterized protein n=1 Tax=marine sediment metagenome TaxID=412755 RepID=X0X8W7_9ZZZZ